MPGPASGKKGFLPGSRFPSPLLQWEQCKQCPVPPQQPVATQRTNEGQEMCALGWSRKAEGEERRIHLGRASHLWGSLKNPGIGDKTKHADVGQQGSPFCSYFCCITRCTYKLQVVSNIKTDVPTALTEVLKPHVRVFSMVCLWTSVFYEMVILLLRHAKKGPRTQW